LTPAKRRHSGAGAGRHPLLRLGLLDAGLRVLVVRLEGERPRAGGCGLRLLVEGEIDLAEGERGVEARLVADRFAELLLGLLIELGPLRGVGLVFGLALRADTPVVMLRRALDGILVRPHAVGAQDALGMHGSGATESEGQRKDADRELVHESDPPCQRVTGPGLPFLRTLSGGCWALDREAYPHRSPGSSRREKERGSAPPISKISKPGSWLSGSRPRSATLDVLASALRALYLAKRHERT